MDGFCCELTLFLQNRGRLTFYSILHVVSYLGGMAWKNGKQGRKHLIILKKEIEKEEIRDR